MHTTEDHKPRHTARARRAVATRRERKARPWRHDRTYLGS